MSKTRIAIIDYGMGNLHSVASALACVAPDATIRITDKADEVSQADRVIFPGVGAIRDCISEIRRLGFDRAVSDAIEAGKPILAICVGMQSLMTLSEENGGVDCLGVIPGAVRCFSSVERFVESKDPNSGERLKVPHMGWNQVRQAAEHPLWADIAQDSRFYFVHSFYVDPDGSDVRSGTSHYGFEFTAAIALNNLFAVQFHPEKSHQNGLQLLKNFVEWDGSGP